MSVHYIEINVYGVRRKKKIVLKWEKVLLDIAKCQFDYREYVHKDVCVCMFVCMSERVVGFYSSSSFFLFRYDTR